jgi:hypothetical protein
MAELKQGNEVMPTRNGPHWVDETYRPPFSHPHVIRDGENWATLAQRYQRPVEQLLLENFRTTNPYHVNWYLREYLKCDTTTPDRYNWRFSNSASARPGPRAGIVFIVPNWPSIAKAAKKATREAVRDWWKTVRFGTPAFTDGAALHYGPGSLAGGSMPTAAFATTMAAGGAPAPLIEAWSKQIQISLDRFAHSITGVHTRAFPTWAHAAAAQPSVATPWAVIGNNANFGLFSPPPMRTIARGLACDGPGAEQVLPAYGLWLERAMRDLAHQVRAVQVRAIPTRLPNGQVRGVVPTQSGVFTDAVLVD